MHVQTAVVALFLLLSTTSLLIEHRMRLPICVQSLYANIYCSYIVDMFCMVTMENTHVSQVEKGK